MAPEAYVITEDLLREAITSVAERDRLIQLLMPRIHAMVLIRLAPSPSQMHSVEDLTQQSLVAVADGLCRLHNATLEGLRAFASRIVANKVADFLRSARTLGGERHASLESSIAGLSSVVMLRDLLPASGLSVGTMVARTELIDRILAELNEMNPRNRDVITFAFFDQLTVSQIAERMEISRAAASMLLVRSVKMLRSRLARKLGPEMRNVS